LPVSGSVCVARSFGMAILLVKNTLPHPRPERLIEKSGRHKGLELFS